MHKTVLVIEASKYLEDRLGALGASGHGLWQKATSIKSSLPFEVREELKHIAKMRNEEVHSTSTWDETDFLRRVLSVAGQIGHVHALHSQRQAVETEIAATQETSATSRSAPQVEPPPIKASAPLLYDHQVVRVIKSNEPPYGQEALDDLVDAANAVAHRAGIITWEPWHAFLYLAKTVDQDDEARLHHLQLAVMVGLDVDHAAETASKYISAAFLQTRLQQME